MKLDELILDLLHIDEGKTNKLIDLKANKLSDTYYLNYEEVKDNAYIMMETIKDRKGKQGNTILLNSAKNGNEQPLGASKAFSWKNGLDIRNTSELHQFIDASYKETLLKGFNPLFLALGAISLKAMVSKDEIKVIEAPFFIVPIQLVRNSDVSPVTIRFIDDDIVFNPCLLELLERNSLSDDLIKNFPHYNGKNHHDFNEPLNILDFDIDTYFDEVSIYMEEKRKEAGITNDEDFLLLRNHLAIAKYHHEEISMYYDIKRNLDKIKVHPLVKKMLENDESTLEKESEEKKETKNVLPYDHFQDEMIQEVLSGSSLVIKGPPGTGKTQTIVNMITSLLNQGKSVLVSSKKLAALSEIYAKMPLELRRFLLLLDSESESEASKEDPSLFKKELNDVLEHKKSYYPSSLIDHDEFMLKKEKIDLEKKMYEMFHFLYETKLYIELTPYQIMNQYLKYDVPSISFLASKDLENLSRNEYLSSLSIVNDYVKQYELLTKNKKTPLSDNIFVHADFTILNYAEIASSYRDLISHVTPLISFLSSLEKKFEKINIKTISLKTLEYGSFAKDLKLKENNDEISFETYFNELFSLFNDNYEEIDSYLMKEPINKRNYNDDETRFISLDNLKEMKVNDFIFFNSWYEFLSTRIKEEEKKDLIFIAVNKISELNQKLLPLRKEMEASFNLIGKEDKLFLKAYNAFKPYENTTLNKPKTFDFKAKGYLKKLKAIAKEEYSFETLIKKVNTYKKLSTYLDEINQNIAFLKEQKVLLNDEDIKQIYQLKSYNLENNDTVSYYLDLIYDIETIQYILKLKDDFNFNQEHTLSFIQRIIHLKVLKEELSSLVEDYKVTNLLDLLSVCATYLFNQEMKEYNKEDVTSLKEELTSFKLLYSKDFKHNCDSVFKQIQEMGLKNSFTLTPLSEFTLATFIKIKEQSEDLTLLEIIKRFDEIRCNKNQLPLKEFFKAFESKEKDYVSYNLNEIYEHSIFKKMVDDIILFMEKFYSCFSLKMRMEDLFNKFYALENKELKQNILTLEKDLYAKINLKDADFSFLAKESGNENIRTIFKKHSEAILKLKKCVILSPSTVSLLFSRQENYDHFDVVIVDEASQIEPVKMLPLLFRAKQCVVVGDEWQMPPIEHFKIKRMKSIENYDDDLELDPSALSYFLRNPYFIKRSLIYHYRSKVESLIRFSQERFYPLMRTFPSPVPKKEGLGFVDCYIQNATCSNGENPKEATKVIECIKTHFSRYFIDNKLTETLGVVVFGEKQRSFIEKMIDEDKTLKEQIRLAYQNKDKNVVDEKIFFLKTIEEVQGQEIDHLILSLTYGVDEKGKIVNRFGELNRDNVGKCIFNVAITRAKSSITVIHSILDSEIDKDNKRVQYIKEYLELVRLFADEKNQFVCDTPSSFFLDVGNKIIKAFNLDPSRIVYNYGVTKGSLRIPLVLLDEDKKEALLGIYCEKEERNKDEYFDTNIRYYEILKSMNHWSLYRLYAYDWIYNHKQELSHLIDFIKKRMEKKS